MLRRSVRILLALSAAILIPLAATGQGMPYCNITGVETRRMPNAVQVTVKSDGIMAAQVDILSYINIDALNAQQWDRLMKPTTSLLLQIPNARSQVGSLSDVGIYPVSHVEITPLRGSAQGIGVELRLQLYTPSYLNRVRLGTNDNFEMDNAGSGISAELSSDRRSIIFLVTSDRRTPTPLVRRVPPAGSPTRLEVTGGPARLGIDALNADLRTLLREVGRVAQVGMVVDAGLERIVSLQLPDMPVGEVADALSLALGLSITHDGPNLLVTGGTVAGEAAYTQAQVETIRLRYLTAGSLRNSLPDFLLAHVRINEGENALTVSGPAPLVAKLAADLRRLDEPVPMVTVEATVVEIASPTRFEAAMGLSGVWRGTGYEVLPAAGDIRVGTVSDAPGQFSARLASVCRSTRSTVRAKPKATALLGRTASLFAGRLQYIQADYYDMLSNMWSTQLLPVKVGAGLSISPVTVGPAGIVLKITPEVSTIANRDPVTGLPEIATRSADCVMLVADGDTVCIGGLRTAQAERGSERIPILGDIPFIGSLFAKPHRSTEATDLAIFATVHLVPGTAVQTASAVPSAPLGDRP